MQLLKWFRTVGALLLGVTLTVALAGSITAAPKPQTSQPKAELSAKSCALACQRSNSMLLIWLRYVWDRGGGWAAKRTSGVVSFGW